jgi:hypothetical protein
MKEGAGLCSTRAGSQINSCASQHHSHVAQRSITAPALQSKADMMLRMPIFEDKLAERRIHSTFEVIGSGPAKSSSSDA